jgi:hypothetical protein
VDTASASFPWIGYRRQHPRQPSGNQLAGIGAADGFDVHRVGSTGRGRTGDDENAGTATAFTTISSGISIIDALEQCPLLRHAETAGHTARKRL